MQKRIDEFLDGKRLKTNLDIEKQAVKKQHNIRKLKERGESKWKQKKLTEM